MSQIAAVIVRRAAQVLLLAAFAGGLGWTCYRSYLHVYEDVRAGKQDDVQPLVNFNPQRKHDWKDLPDNIQLAFDDRIENRDIYVGRFARWKLNQLGVSPSNRVWLGYDNWLFYNHEAESNFFAANDPRLTARLQQWITAWPRWQTWLAERGIRLQIVVAPDKQSVYREYLPTIEQKREAIAPLDRILQELAAQAPAVKVLDLRGPIRAANAQHVMYYKFDTHWVPRAAYHGYVETAQSLGLTPRPLSDFRIHTIEKDTDGDLVRKLGLVRKPNVQFPFPHETFDTLVLISARAKPVAIAADAKDITRLDYLNAQLFEQPDKSLPKAVLFHDSFGDGLYRGLLADHYSRLMAVPSNHMDPEVIEREKPDVVILELVERLFQGIGTRLPTDPPLRSLTR